MLTKLKDNMTKSLDDKLSRIMSVTFQNPGLEIRGCRDPRAPLHSLAAPSNFCREPKDVLISIHNTFK